MNVEAIATTARMFEALGVLTEGGDSAIETLGENLVNAIHELAGMIADFEGTVGEASSSNESLIDKVGGFASSLNPFSSKDKSPAPSTKAPSVSSGSKSGGGGEISQKELIAEIKRLQTILTSGDAVVQVETAL
jgi:hypothetical protein